MKKDPAFLFYSKDWIQGTAQLMPEEKGVYIDLLAHQHQDKDLPNDTKRLARIVGMSDKDFNRIWNTLKQKFIVVDNNRLVNRKLTNLVGERKERSKQNTIIGTLAAIVRLCEEPYDVKYAAKKGFNYKEFIEIHEDDLTNVVTEWFVSRLKSIGNGNEDGNGNDIIDSIGEHKISKHQEQMIVQDMYKVWMKHNPDYQYDETVDFPALLNLAYKIAKSKKWEPKEVIKEKLAECIASWDNIALFVKGDKFYKKFEIKGINNNWASLYQAMKAARDEQALPPKQTPPSNSAPLQRLRPQ